eukprot:5558917-Pleurochrysis_carterae.AAC.1
MSLTMRMSSKLWRAGLLYGVLCPYRCRLTCQHAQAAALAVSNVWTAKSHTDLTKSYPGGGAWLIDSALKGVSSLYGISKHNRPKPYLTVKEAADATEALEALEEDLRRRQRRRLRGG